MTIPLHLETPCFSTSIYPSNRDDGGDVGVQHEYVWRHTQTGWSRKGGQRGRKRLVTDFD